MESLSNKNKMPRQRSDHKACRSLIAERNEGTGLVSSLQTDIQRDKFDISTTLTHFIYIKCNKTQVMFTFICTIAPGAGAACEGGAPVYSRKDV